MFSHHVKEAIGAVLVIGGVVYGYRRWKGASAPAVAPVLPKVSGAPALPSPPPIFQAGGNTTPDGTVAGSGGDQSTGYPASGANGSDAVAAAAASGL